MQILLAEDDTASQLLMERWLNMADHNVTIANNGQEALNYLDTQSYDICIFDMQMPVMSGIEAVESYKNKNPKSNLPFIMLTANIEKHAIAQCKKAGANIHLAKPIVYKTLIETINTACIGTYKSFKKDSVIDLTQLDYVDDPIFMNKFIDIFEDSVDKLTEDLGNALNNNYETFMKIIHSIKGLSGNIGAHALRDITTNAEKINEDVYNKNSSEYYNNIVDELSKARVELVKFSNKSKSSEK